MNLDPDKVIKVIGRPVAIIDCLGIRHPQRRQYLSLFEIGCGVKGIGWGHVKGIKNSVRS